MLPGTELSSQMLYLPSVLEDLPSHRAAFPGTKEVVPGGGETDTRFPPALLVSCTGS